MKKFQYKETLKPLRAVSAVALACCLAAASGLTAFADSIPEDSENSPSKIVIVKNQQDSNSPEKVVKDGVVIVRSGASQKTSSAALPKLYAPLVEVDEYRDRMKVTWKDLNPSASGYVVEIRSGADNQLIEEKRFSKYETSYRTDYKPEEGVTYTFRVKALGEEGFAESNFAAAQYNSDSLRVYRPRGLELKVEDQTLQASWDEADSAGSYRFLLVDPKGKVLVDTITSSSYHYLENVRITEKGQYTMYVQAREDGRSSPFSKYYRQIESRNDEIEAPTILKTEFLDDGSLEVFWEEVEHAKSYTIKLRTFGSNQTYLTNEITTSDTNYTFKNIKFRKNYRYVVEIRSNGEKGYAKSDFEATATDYYGW